MIKPNNTRKTRMINLVERLDLRIPLAEVKLAEQKRLNRPVAAYDKLPASDYIVVGAVTELNYNITSGGIQLFVQGIGGGGRSVIVNVALDLRVVDARNFSIKYVTSLQKQIYGFEVEANVFRFFGSELFDVNLGAKGQEPLQLGIRTALEEATLRLVAVVTATDPTSCLTQPASQALRTASASAATLAQRMNAAASTTP